MCYPQVSFVSSGELGNVIRSKESCAYRRVHLSSVVEQFDSSDVPTASQSLAWTAVRLFSEQESSQHRKVTTSLDWAIPMCAGPPATLECKKQFDSSDAPTASQSLAWTAVRLFSEQESSQRRKVTTSLDWAIPMCVGPSATLDCNKRSNSRLAESRRRVDGVPAKAFVNWANPCSMAYSSMHSRAVSLFLSRTAIPMCAGPPATLDCKKRSNSRLAESRRRVDGVPAKAFMNWANLCSMAYSSMHSRAISLSLSRTYSVLRTIGRSRSGTRLRFLRGILDIELCRGCRIPVSVFLVGY